MTSGQNLISWGTKQLAVTVGLGHLCPDQNKSTDWLHNAILKSKRVFEAQLTNKFCFSDMSPILQIHLPKTEQRLNPQKHIVGIKLVKQPKVGPGNQRNTMHNIWAFLFWKDLLLKNVLSRNKNTKTNVWFPKTNFLGQDLEESRVFVCVIV